MSKTGIIYYSKLYTNNYTAHQCITHQLLNYSSAYTTGFIYLKNHSIIHYIEDDELDTKYIFSCIKSNGKITIKTLRKYTLDFALFNEMHTISTQTNSKHALTIKTLQFMLLQQYSKYKIQDQLHKLASNISYPQTLFAAI